MGETLMTLGLVIGGINYLVTAGYFFSNNDALLGLIQLFVPPAEVIMPWIASPTLGIVSLISLGMMLGGAALKK
jgi:hypothetical protein